jgi:hypothetical protein
MKRHLEPVDMMVAVGVFATIIGGYALFWATSGAVWPALSEPLPMAGETGVRSAAEWVQPALGQAIVDEAVALWNGSRAMTRVVRALNQATMADHRLRAEASRHVDQIGAYAAGVTRDQAARVQFVLGRTVTNFTARGVRSGVLTPETMRGEYNRVMIAMAESTGYQMEEAFRETWQSHLGGLIVAAGQDYLQFAGQSQGRIGRSVVGLTLVQDASRAESEGIQERLASVALAAINTERIEAGSVRVATVEGRGGPAAGPATQSRTWPELPAGALVAAATALVGIFVMGVSLPMGRPGRRAKPVEEKAPPPSYRKTA